MGEITTLSVLPHSRTGPHGLAPWTIRDESFERLLWHRRGAARPKRLREAPECREFLNPKTTLPSIRIHGSACRCVPGQSESQAQDALLAARIASYTRERLAKQPPSPPPSTRDSHSHGPQRSVPVSRSRGSSLLSTFTRLLSSSLTPSPTTPPPCIQLQADLVIGCADLDIDKVARYLLPSAKAPSRHKSRERDSGRPLPVNMPNHVGMTPLMAAVRSHAAGARPTAHLEMVKFLVDCCGADVDAVRVDRVTGLGESVLSMACAVGAAEVVRFLVSRNVAVDARLPVGAGIRKGLIIGKGATALHVAVLADHVDCVEVLVREGKANVNAIVDLAEGAETGMERGFKILSGRARGGSRGASGNVWPRHPVTPLHLAHGSVACARVLVDHGADWSAKDGHGRTPGDWAAVGGHLQVVQLLMATEGDTSSSTDGAGFGLACLYEKRRRDSSGHIDKKVQGLQYQDRPRRGGPGRRSRRDAA